MMRRVSESSETMEHPLDEAGEQEPHYFTFEVSWEVANKGISYQMFAHCAFSLERGERIGAQCIHTPLV